MAKKQMEKGVLSVHTENIFPIIKRWLYSQHDIFLRELVSNAIDAINKRKYADPDFKAEDMKIEIELDDKKKTLKVIDTGIGMTADEIRRYINQIAFSGAEEFVNRFKDVQNNIIGHFGLGFYSSFMVADKVTIDSLSWDPGSEAAFWECDGSTDYSMSEGKRKEVGTTITIHFNAESEEYAKESKIKEILERYCNFLPWPIMFKKEQVNLKEALWNRNPKDITREEYIKFYHDIFHDYQEPVFWIHLNVDFPFNLKGILYFPQLRMDRDFYKGQVKVYCNNVFVAENLEDLLPEFLLLLRGGIDIPDIPLNVSRSFLQNDKQVQKISKYVIKKVADHFADVFKNDRKKYEEYWEDINSFIKFGMLQEEDFFEAMKDMVIFKTASGDYVTVEEYKTRNKSDDERTRIWYASSENTQVSYLNLMKEQGIEVIFQNTYFDTHFYKKLEHKLDKVEFIRVDSEVSELVENKKEAEDTDAIELIRQAFYRGLGQKITASFSEESLKEFFKKHPEAAEILAPHLRQEEQQSMVDIYDIPLEQRKRLGQKALDELMGHVYKPITIEAKSLKSAEIPAMIVFEEQMRRWMEESALSRGMAMDSFSYHTLMVNLENPIIKKILELEQAGHTEDVDALSAYIHDLSLLEQKPFSGKELKDFVERANKVLKLIK